MSLLERRLQLLLDAERYERVAAEAERSGRSVAAVIREAIDLRFPDAGDDGRARSATLLLDLTAAEPVSPGPDPGELKRAYAAELEGKLAPS